MFGPKTNVMLTRITSILSTLFFFSCVILALLSARQSRSLIEGVKIPQQQASEEKQTSDAQTQIPTPKNIQNTNN